MTATPKFTSLLKGKRALIFGGTSGIGFAVASALIEEGAHVIVSSSSQSKVDETVKRLRDSDQQYNADTARVEGKVCNLKGEGMDQSISAIFEGLSSPLDYMIYTAGDPLAVVPLQDLDYRKIIEAGQVRFTAALLACKYAQPHLSTGGAIILTTGSISVHPRPDWTVVAGYAGGLISLGRQLAYDFSKYDVRVNVVSPGAVETELWHGIPEAGRKKILQAAGEASLTKKVGQPEEVAQTYLGLLKDTNITGETIYSDSGSRYGPPLSKR